MQNQKFTAKLLVAVYKMNDISLNSFSLPKVKPTDPKKTKSHGQQKEGNMKIHKPLHLIDSRYLSPNTSVTLILIFLN